MFYSYADKQGEGFFWSWQLRQVAFDTMRRYLYYSEPTRDAVPIEHRSTTLVASASAESVGGSSQTATSTPTAAEPSTKVLWKRKMKVTSVVPVATRPQYVQRTANERDLYQLEVKGESRQLATGECPSAGPLLCPAAGLSNLERGRCNADNDAYIRDPFFLKELFDALRDQFEEMSKAKMRAAAAAADGSDDVGAGGAVDCGVQTLVSPRKPKGETGGYEAVVPVRVILRCRDEREFRRLWYVLQTVLGYDKLIIRPYRGLPPYDPRNGVAFAHIPMAVWHTFQPLDKAVFYTFMRGNFYALESAGVDAANASASSATRASSISSSEGRSQLTAVPQLRRVLEGAYLCITHDSVLCMRESGNIPRWLRLSEVKEFHWNVTAAEAQTRRPTPFCVFLSDAPVPDLFFEPTAPAFGADAIAAYDPLVDVRRIAHVIHDTCFASFSTRRVIRMKEVQEASMPAYVAAAVREGRRLPGLQTGTDFNSTLSCPLPKEQLAVVWQQVQSELLERGNMANRAAIPIYRTNARDVELSEDQLSTVERELDDERERRDDVVGMPLERARQLERRRRATAQRANAHRGGRQRHRDARNPASVAADGTATAGSGRHLGATTTTTQVMPLTMELLQTPQLQGRFATTVAQLQQQGRDGAEHDHSIGRSSNPSSPVASTAGASEYSSYLVPGARYLSQEEWLSGGYGGAEAAAAATTTAAAAALPRVLTSSSPTPQAAASSRPSAGVAHLGNNLSGSAVEAGGGCGAGGRRIDYGEERTVNEIVGHSMAALDGSRVDLDQMER